MAAKATTTARTKKTPEARSTRVTKKGTGTKRAAGTTRTATATRGAATPPSATSRSPASAGTEDDLLKLRAATRSVYERLREIDEDALPEDRTQEYWRDRHIARAAWEHAENAAFENLVDQQKQQLPAVRASNAKLAKDVQTMATILGVLDLVSASLGIIASVISLLA